MTTVLGEGSRLGRGLLTRLTIVLIAGLYLAVGTMTTPARAHAERVASKPEADAKLSEAPTSLSIDFSEPPTGDANLVVMDGCDNDVVDEITVENMNVSASLGEGQPGKWVVRSTVVSGIDGHETTDSWSFSVIGQKDCSAPNDDEPTDAEGDDGDDEDSSFPIVPVAIGTLAVVGIALLLRRITGRSDD